MFVAVVALNDVKNGLVELNKDKRSKSVIESGILGAFRTAKALLVYGIYYATEYHVKESFSKWVLRGVVVLVSPGASLDMIMSIKIISFVNGAREFRKLGQANLSEFEPVLERATDEFLKTHRASEALWLKEWWKNSRAAQIVMSKEIDEIHKIKDQILKTEGNYEKFIAQGKLLKQLHQQTASSFIVGCLSVASRFLMSLVEGDYWRGKASRLSHYWYDPLSIDQKCKAASSYLADRIAEQS